MQAENFPEDVHSVPMSTSSHLDPITFMLFVAAVLLAVVVKY